MVRRRPVAFAIAAVCMPLASARVPGQATVTASPTPAGSPLPIAGTTIVNQSTGTYSDAGGANYFTTSNDVVVTVQNAPGATLAGTGGSVVTGGQSVTDTFVVTNSGNANATFAIVAQQLTLPAGATPTLAFRLADAQGHPTGPNLSADALAGTAVARGGSLTFFATYLAPANASGPASTSLTISLTQAAIGATGTGGAVPAQTVTATATASDTLATEAQLDLQTTIADQKPNASSFTVETDVENSGGMPARGLRAAASLVGIANGSGIFIVQPIPQCAACSGAQPALIGTPQASTQGTNRYEPLAAPQFFYNHDGTAKTWDTIATGTVRYVGVYVAAAANGVCLNGTVYPVAGGESQSKIDGAPGKAPSPAIRITTTMSYPTGFHSGDPGAFSAIGNGIIGGSYGNILGPGYGDPSSGGTSTADGSGIDVSPALTNTRALAAPTGASNVVADEAPPTWTQTGTVAGTNMGFEFPAYGYGGYEYRPAEAGVGWTFTGQAGITRLPSAWASWGAAQGSQVAFCQGICNISQAIDGFVDGATYTITFTVAQRPLWNSAPGQDFSVTVDGTAIKHYQPPFGVYTDYTSPPFVAAGTAHTIGFAGFKSTGLADTSVFFDNVRITQTSGPAPVSNGPLGNPAAAGDYTGTNLAPSRNGDFSAVVLPLGGSSVLSTGNQGASTATIVAPAGTVLVVGHTLQNAGNAADRFTLAATTTLPAGWSVVFYPDTGSGPDYAHPISTTTPSATIASGATLNYDAVYTVGPSPAVTMLPFTKFDTTITAVSASAPPATPGEATHDEIFVNGFLRLTTTVTPATAKPGDTITYVTTYQNLAPPASARGAIGNLSLTAHNFAVVVDGNAAPNTWGTYTTGVSKTNLFVDPVGTIDISTGPAKFIDTVGTLAPGASGTLTYSLKVNSNPTH